MGAAYASSLCQRPCRDPRSLCANCSSSAVDLATSTSSHYKGKLCKAAVHSTVRAAILILHRQHPIHLPISCRFQMIHIYRRPPRINPASMCQRRRKCSHTLPESRPSFGSPCPPPHPFSIMITPKIARYQNQAVPATPGSLPNSVYTLRPILKRVISVKSHVSATTLKRKSPRPGFIRGGKTHSLV